MKIIICLTNFILIFLYSSSKRCGLEYLKKPKRILVKQEKENRMLLQNDKWESIRIHFDYSYLENNIGRFQKEDLIDLKERVLPKTQEILHNLIRVKRIQNKLKLNAPHCETFPIPEKYHEGGEGVDADLVIFVIIDDSGMFLKNQVEAAALHCLQHFETKRPIAGYIQFKPYLHVNNTIVLDYMTWLSLHEITHILLFNGGLYEDYIDSNTLIPLGLDRVTGSKKLPDGKKMKYIKTKNVREKASAHFNCADLEGIPLEHHGGPGTVGGHWSKKYMNTDYMIPDSYGENLISDITLALFEDSGWYKVDYEQANLFLWGKNQGCDFFTQKCIEKKEGALLNPKGDNYYSRFKNEFCSRLNYPVCSRSYLFRGICAAKEYAKELDIHERYFRNPKIGGANMFLGKCPIALEELDNGRYYGTSCRVGDLSLVSAKIEKICPDCACFMSSLDYQEKQITNNSITSSNNSTSILFKRKRRFKAFLRSASESEFQNTDVLFENVSMNITLLNSSQGINSTTMTNLTEEILEDWPIIQKNDLVPACFEFKCKEGNLYIVILNKETKCPSHTQIIVQGFEGLVTCPENDDLCHPKYKCKFGCIDHYDNNNIYQMFREEKSNKS